MRSRTFIGIAMAGAVAGGFTLAATAEARTAEPAQPPAAEKDGASGKAGAASATTDEPLPSSAPGEYVGDCFRVHASPPGTGLTPGRIYMATDQAEVGNDDRSLTLIEGEVVLGIDSRKWFPGPACRPRGATPGGPAPQLHRGVLASELIASGASRQGYAYGFLTMPYKYYPGEKDFQVNVPIGGYFGWRWGQAGSGSTAAFALTLSTVEADTVDPAAPDGDGRPTRTGTSNVAALSMAVGLMFDVLKSPRGRPFKAGVFVGRDVISRSETISYRFDRKTWVALQLGYEFTDD